ncbi:MAG TPA: LysE family translocator [Streptosporangiaceae bacterium]|jgi:threonine/homoserine/homoserine lactone efflux protein|nr:LysE family translocator [Streptosporangiaceae bacterium]
MTAALLAFALAATVLILAPGPDSLLVMRNTLRGGRRAGWVTAGGTLSGLLVWVVAAVLGLSELLRVSRVGFDILRLAGAAYLIWLGVSSLGLGRRQPARRKPARHPPGTPATPRVADEPAGAAPAGWPRVYLNGLLSNLFNPKIGVFFVAFLPGFIPAGAPAAQFSLALGLWFIAETGAWLATLAWLVARGVGWLRRSAVQRWLERVTGLVLIGFGVRLATLTR